MSPVQRRSVGEYPAVYGVVKSFNDRPRGSTLRAYRAYPGERAEGAGEGEGGGGGGNQGTGRKERKRARGGRTLETASNLAVFQMSL